jgi:hypothetical protein
LVGDNYCQEYAIVNNKKRQVYIPFYLLLCASAALRDKKNFRCTQTLRISLAKSPSRQVILSFALRDKKNSGRTRKVDY